MHYALLAFWLLTSCFAVSAGASDDFFDIDLWHQDNPIEREDPADDNRFQLGLYPRINAIVGIPNGIAASVQLSLSFHKPGKFSFYIGGGYEVGPAVKGSNITLGWGGVRDAPATVPQLGFSGAFLRLRDWRSDDHGEHHGMSVGIESGLGALGITLEAGLARSDQNHWIPVARISFSVGHALSWKLGAQKGV